LVLFYLLVSCIGLVNEVMGSKRSWVAKSDDPVLTQQEPLDRIQEVMQEGTSDLIDELMTLVTVQKNVILMSANYVPPQNLGTSL
jgi:hypothetical protein